MAISLMRGSLKSQVFSSELCVEYGRKMVEGLDNMRKLVYAFYDQNFSFRKLTDKYEEAAGAVTDCLSGDVNKDFSKLYAAVAEMAEVPEPLPYGMPLIKKAAQMSAA